MNLWTSCKWNCTVCFPQHWAAFAVLFVILGDSVSKESACNARHPSSIPGSGRSPEKGMGCPFQYSCLGNPQREAWMAIIHRIARVEHNLATKPSPPPTLYITSVHWFLFLDCIKSQNYIPIYLSLLSLMDVWVVPFWRYCEWCKAFSDVPFRA